MSEEKNPIQGLSRRSFLKTSAAVAGLTAASGTVTALAAGEASAPVEEQYFYNNCRGNCGYNNCILKGVVREGRLVQCKPIYPDHDYPFWKTGCVKGQTNPQRLYAEDRVLYPLKRVGARGAGEWQRVSWDEAMTDIANKMLDAQKKYGDASVGFWHGFSAGGILNRCLSVVPCRPRGGITIGFERFIFKSGATVLTPSADMAVIYGVWELLGLGNEDSISMRDSKTILVWGFNPSESGRAEFGYIRDAQENGATVITIDPRFTRTAAISDMWLPIRPGTDGLLALAMCNYILDNNLIDEDFLMNQSIAPFLIKEDGKYLRLSDLAAPAAEGEEAAPAAEGEDSQVVYDPATESFISHRAAVNPALHGEYEVNGIKVRTVYDYVVENIKEYTVERAVKECDLPKEKIEFAARCYATKKPGGVALMEGIGHHHNSFHNYKNIAFLAALTGNMYKNGTYFQIEINSCSWMYTSPAITMGLYTALAVPDTKANRQAFSGEEIIDILETGKFNGQDFPLKVIYNLRGNPLATAAGRQDLIKALDKVDLFVVADPLMSDTAKYADYVLPVAMSWEMMDAGLNPSILEKAVEPAGECKSDIDIFRLLADKMGYKDLYVSDQEYLDMIFNDESAKAVGMSLDDVKKAGYFFIPTNPEERFKGPQAACGRLQFYLEEVVPKDDHLRPFDQLAYRRPFYEEPAEASVNNPLHQKYPLFPAFTHDMMQAHSFITKNPWLDEIRRDPYMELSPKAAEDRGIKTGDTVRVFNDRGYVVLKAVINKGLRDDTIHLPHGWQSADYIAGHHQDLTRSRLDLICGNNCFNDFLCEVEKYEGSVK